MIFPLLFSDASRCCLYYCVCLEDDKLCLVSSTGVLVGMYVGLKATGHVHLHSKTDVTPQ